LIYYLPRVEHSYKTRKIYRVVLQNKRKYADLKFHKSEVITNTYIILLFVKLQKRTTILVLIFEYS